MTLDPKALEASRDAIRLSCNETFGSMWNYDVSEKFAAVAVSTYLAALSKEVQASEAVAFADPKGNLLIPEGSPLIEMLKSLPDGPFGGEVCPLCASPSTPVGEGKQP